MRFQATGPPLYLIILLTLLFLGAHSISNKVFYPISSNMGLRTDYYMSFTPDLTYTLPSMNIKFSIPLEYNLSQISNDMECFISLTGTTNSYFKMSQSDCFVQPNLNTTQYFLFKHCRYSLAGDLIINVANLSSASPLHFVFRNIDNPKVDSSSYFGLCVRSGIHLLECDKQFKMLTFTPDFRVSNEGFKNQTNPLKPIVGQGTTYYFKLRTNITLISQQAGYDLNNEFVQLRVVFPKQYSSSNAICSLMQLSPITGTYSAIQVTTSSTPSKSYSIECKRIQNFVSAYLFNQSSSILQDLYLKIQNIQNPIYSGTYLQYVYVDISRGGRNQIVQRIKFPIDIQIYPEELIVNVDQTHMMRNATTLYFFYLTHDLNYGQNSRIRLTIGNSSISNNSYWKIHDVKLMFGFTNNLNFTSKITNSLAESIVEISNYGLASKQVQQVIAMNLTSSIVEGDHIVKAETFIDNKTSGTWNSIVKLNSTWGSFNRLSYSAVQQPTKLPVGKTGPLQFTLFLNYQLPESQNIQNGSMIIQFTPKIPTPDPDIYGKVKCYFKATMQAAQCNYDNSDPTKTKVTIVSPPYDEFQYSQIPIIITTQGGIDDQHLGLTISQVVQRYKFQVDFFLYNSSTIPSQVLYTNWLADAIQLPGTLTGKSLSWQANQLTALHFNLVTPLMTTPQNRLLFQFNPDLNGRNAWDRTLGYDQDKIYKQFPCVVVGLPGDRIRCDLYTYVNNVGPYNKLHIRSRSLGPFFMVYGFTNAIPQGINIQVYFPGIKTSTNVGANAMVSFSILQETPGDTEPYIQLYHQDYKLFTLINAPTILPSLSITNPTQVPVQTLKLYSMTWSPISPANIAFIKYDFTKEIPSFQTKFDTCSIAQTCYTSGYPNNWMVQIPNAGNANIVTSPHTLTSTLNMLTMPHIPSLITTYPVKITTYSATGQTLQIININHDYIPKVMSGTFALLDTSLQMYAGLKQWYEIAFTATTATTSAYPFVHLRLSPELKFAKPQQCQAFPIMAFNQTGMKCVIVAGSSDREMIVSNIKAISPNAAYRLKVRLQTTAADYAAPIPIPTVDILVNHNQSIVNSLVQQKRTICLAPTTTPTPIMARPDQFIINNPQVLNQQVRVNYIGRLFIDFTSTTALTTNFRITLPNHRYNGGKWSTANQAAAIANPLKNDPLVCMLNGVRFYCTQTINPLIITIKSAIFKSGTNRLQLDTQYVIPYNGLYFPTKAGNYQIHFETVNPTNNLWIPQHTFYTYIHPPSLEDIQIASIVKDVGTESVYLLNFTIADTIAIPAANHAAGTWSRIFIQFPTIVNGQRVFKDNLGDYQGVLNERVGCAFLKGPRYVVAESTSPDTSRLECRLIPPEIPGAPVKVQVINFGAFSATVDSLGLFIFKVQNPGTDINAINSFEIKVKINNYASTGEIYPLFESDYVVFLDPRTKNLSPQNFPSSQSELTNFFDMALDVGDTGKIQMKAQSITPGAPLPFYMLVKLPPYLPVPYDTLAAPAFYSCPASNFQYCISAPDINYVLVKARTNPSFFQIKIKDYPLGISKTDSKFYSMIIEAGRYKGNIEYIISQEKRWLDIRGDIIFNYIQPVGLIEKADIYKQRFHVAIQFKTANYIPETGTIQIVFPASVTKIYPYCRSDTSNVSSLLKTVSGTSGEIGCAVQNTNHWVITGFAAVPAATTITISGYIDLPIISGSLGLAEIITYADNHPDNIYLNGSQIDYVKPYFNLVVQNVMAMNPNEDIFLSQRDVVRAGDVASFRVLMKLPFVLTTTGTITLDFSKNDFNGNAGGFQLFPLPKKVCELIDITSEYRVKCQVISQQDLTSDGQSYIRYILRVFEDLVTTTTYEVRLTTNARNTAPDAPQGIKYPTVPSTYKIEFNIKYSSTTTDFTIQQLYLDVYGPQFNFLKVTQHNYIQNQYNLYWFEVQPFATIKANHQLVIQFPTKSNDGLTTLFTNNLGLNQYESGDEIAMDIFDSTIAGLALLVPPVLTVGNDFMKCHIHHGHQASGIPVKVICGNFMSDILITDTLRFAIGIVNPFLTSTQLSIPIMVYSQDPYIFTRTNFNLVNGAGYIYDTSNILSKDGYATTTSLQMEMPNDDFIIGHANTYALMPGDAYVVKFGFPIRKNDKVPGGCKSFDKSITYGDAIYHERLRTVVCKIPLVTGVSIGLQLTPASADLLFEGFYTPWYYLAASQQKLYAIAHYYSRTQSEVVEYTDPFPILPPRYQFIAPSILTMTPQLNLMMTQCQRNDYVFTIQLDPSGAGFFNLQYTKLIGIVFPLSTDVDYVFFGRDCVEHTSSQIQVKLCDINEVARTIYIQIRPGIYQNSKIIAIQTKGLAIGNPCLVPNTDVTKLVVNFFSWQNITSSQKRDNNRVYMKMDTLLGNLPPIASVTNLTFLAETSNAAGGYFRPFDWVEIPNQKYFDQFHQFKDGQYSPFKFDLQLTTAIAAQSPGDWNTLTLYYGDKFDIPSPQDQYINDLKYNTEYCYLRNTRIQKCENDFANKKITMYFEFDLPITEWINVYFSIQNPMDREINGFKYIGSDSDIADGVSLELMQFGATSSFLFKVNPFQAKQTNFDPALTQNPQRAIINGVIDYGNALPSQLNVIDITLTLNTSVTDIKGLKFEIPLVDEFGVQIFDAPATSFMDLNDGEQYPCGNNDDTNTNSGKAKCYLFMGSNLNMGQPTAIIMTDFIYTSQIRARFLIKNPGVAGKWVTVVVKAYKGDSGGQSSLIGHKYVGYWRFYNIFQTVAGTFFQSASTPATATQLFPSNPALAITLADTTYDSLNPLWMDSTTWTVTGTPVTGGIPAATGQYVIFEAYINRYNASYEEPEFCEVDWTIANTMSDDMFYYKSRAVADKFQKVYFVKKWTGAVWQIQFLKCKHYLNDFVVYYHGSKLDQSISVYSIPFATFVYPSYTAPTIKYFEVMNARMQIEIDLSPSLAGAISTRGLNWENNVNYIMVIYTDTTMPFTSISACYATGGFENTQGKAVTCTTSGTYQFVIKNFNKIITNHLGQYSIRIDAPVSVGTITLAVTPSVTVQIYANNQAYNAGQYMYSAISSSYARSYTHYGPNPAMTSTCVCAGWADYLAMDEAVPPVYAAADAALIVAYNNYYQTPLVNVEVQKTLVSPTTLYLQVKIQPVTTFAILQDTHRYFMFRFTLEGVHVNCGTSYSVFGNSIYGLDANGNPTIPSRDLTRGFTCDGPNRFQYNSYTHTQGNAAATANRASTSHQAFADSFYGMSDTFASSEFIVFYITVNGISPAVEPSWTRDWVGVKVQIHKAYIVQSGTCCCVTCTLGGCCSSQNNYNRYQAYLGYGQGFDIKSPLFTSGVTLTALTNYINEETELQVIMRNSYVPIHPTTTGKLLLLEFDSGSTVLFPYINTTSNLYNYLIECNCLVSGQADFSGATTYTNLDCYMKYRPVPNIYAHTAISVNLIAPQNSYIKCYFPGFKVTSAMSLSVTAKIVNKGINQAIHPDPLTGSTYGSIYRTTSNSMSFSARPAGNPLNTPTVTQTPNLYGGSTKFTIKSLYNTMGGYNLAVNFGGNVLVSPTFYVNFQKGGPMPDTSLCSSSSTYQFCRIYSKYRNIMVAKYISNTVTTGTFASFSASLPKAKQPNVNSQYDMIVSVKQVGNPSYSYSQVVTRTNPDLLVPSTTIFSAFPDRITSNNYATFTSNIILSFKLEGHALDSFWKGESKIQIQYDQPAYFTLNKGCIVSTDLINADQMFSFYCEIDTSLQLIKIQNRRFNSPFSASGLIQVAVGAINQADTVPIKFTLRMYKWWISATNYGLLIQKDVTYTPFSVAATQSLQLRDQIKQYPFYTRFYSDSYAPFRMAFKLAPSVSAPLTFVNDLTTYMILDDFDGVATFVTLPFECYLREYPNPTTNLLLPHHNGYRNYKQNTQYYFIPTTCTNVVGTTYLRLEIPRNRDLDNTKYYELVVMPVASTKTGFDNVDDLVAKLNIFPLMTAGHYFEIKTWKKAAFTLNSLWIVTTRPLQPNAIQLTFTTNFAPPIPPGPPVIPLVFPDNYIEVIFNNLQLLRTLPSPYNEVGATIPCSLSTSFNEIINTTRVLRPNCIVTYVDYFHQVIKIRVENFQLSSAATFQLSFDDFLLPEITNLLQLSNTFSVCMAYWSATKQHERCFGEIFVIDRYINLLPRVDSTTAAAFLPLDQLKHGAPSSPTIQLSYPATTTSQRNQKVMIRIAGGYSANNPAPLSFTGSTMLWHNPMINLYIQRLTTIAVSTPHQIVISGVRNPYPYEMEEYMTGCSVELTYFREYYPINKYYMLQPAYPDFIMNMPLVKLGTAYFDDIKTSIAPGSQSIVKLSVDIVQTSANLVLHQNDRFEIEFVTNVAKVKRCWVVTSATNIQYSTISVCTPKPGDPTRLQLLNFFKANTNNDKTLTIYAVIEASTSSIQIKSHLYAKNDQEEFQSSLIASIMSVSPMTNFNELTFTESHYMPGYYEQIISPVTQLSTVEMIYLSFFLPEKLYEVNSVFTILLNTTLSIKPSSVPDPLNTRLICEWMRVSKYGRQYETGKFSHCIYTQPNIIVNAPTWNLQMSDASGRIPYLLKIREESPTASTFIYPLTSQVQEIILQSATGGIFKKDTLRVRPYNHFLGLTTKHTTLTVSELNTITVSYLGPAMVGTGAQFVLTLELDSKHLPPTLGIEDIYDLYGQNSKNTSIIDNSQHYMVDTSLPNKWLNGIPYSGWTSVGSSPLLTTVQKSQKTVRINLLLPAYSPTLVWKIPLLKNPAGEMPYRMNLTLWSYPGDHTQGHKQLFYEIINQHVTKVPAVTIPTVAYDISLTAQTNNKIQTLTNSMNVQFPTFTPTTNDIIEAKILARAVGLVSMPSFWTGPFADTSYNFFFFKNINFVIGEKNTNDASKLINFGAIEVANDYSDEYGYEWLKVHSAQNMETTKRGAQVKRNIPACQVPLVTYTRMSGIDTIQNGKFEAKFTFTNPCKVLVNSTLKLIASGTDLDFLPISDEAYCETSFRSSNCWLDSSKILYVRINQQLPNNTVLSITTFAKSKSRTVTKPIVGQIYAIPTKPSTLSNTLPLTAVFPATASTVLNNAAMFPLLIKPLYERTLDPLKPDYYTKLTGTFKTGHLPFSYMSLYSPFAKLMTSNETFFYQVNTTSASSPYVITEDSLNLNWMRSKSTTSTNSNSLETIQSNLPDGPNSYAVQTGLQYRFTIGSMYETTDLNNYKIGPVGAYYQFEYRTDKQIAYHEVYPVPIAQFVTVINPLPQIGQETVLGIEFTSTRQEIRPLDKIEIQLDSHNLIENMYLFTKDKLECIEFVRGTLTVTNTDELVCEVAQYPDAATKKPMIIHVFPTKIVPINTAVKIWISPIINSPNVLVAGVTVRLLRYCSGQKLCTLYEGRGWYKTINMTAVVDYGTTVATFAPSSTMVLETMKNHVYTFNAINLATAFIKYPENYQDVMPLVCTRTGNTCLVFPKQRKVVTMEAGTSATTISVNGMTNGIYILPDNNIDLKLASTTNLDKYQIIHPLLVERNYRPASTILNFFDIINTQNSNNIFLRNYWNTVKLQFIGLFTTPFVKAFYITTPPEVTDWQIDYCNATIESAAHLPYPTRLECKQITVNTIQIIIPEGVNYVTAVSDEQILTVHAKFWIVDFPVDTDILYVSDPVPSGLFQAYGSFRADSFLDKYRITKVTKQIMISQHKTPLISQVAFNTESFEQRLASINDPTTFDILIDPYTDGAIDKVDFMQIIIPQDFKYPNVLFHDMCQLIYRRVAQLPSCKQTRKDNQTIITIDVDQTVYDNGPRILKIASRNMTNWFTAPSIPGILYNMTISLYGTSGQLLEKQTTKNSSRIKGYDIKLPSIVVENGHDELQQQIYDLSFIVGPVGIKQGYKGILAQGEYYSEIKVKFETVEGYQYLLGGYYKHGDRVGCVTNLKSINKEIACIFSMGTNITHQPAIIISNYEQIIPIIPVRLSFANINNLPSTLRNTLSVQVKYYLVGDATEDQKYSYMMYEPTEAITDATTAFTATSPVDLAIVSYPGQTIVNEPTTFRIELKPTNAIAITDYIVVKFPKNGLRDEYSRFNPVCDDCSKVQIFYRAEALRIYPKLLHPAGQIVIYTITGFPSSEYIVDDSSYPITVEVYNSLKIVHTLTSTINLKMQGCKLSSGIIASTSPYIGDAGVIYTFEAQVNVSQLSRSDEPKQLNMMIKLPQGSAWFNSQSSCEVELPLYCSIDDIQKRIVVKNLLSYAKSTISIKTFNVINPSALTTLTTLNFSSSLYEETTVSNVVQQNTICVGGFGFTYMPSPPNKCTMSLKSEHFSTTKENILTFGIVCEKAIRNSTSLYFMISRDITFNNPSSSEYRCWASNPSVLLDNRCQIVFVNGTFYMKSMGMLNIGSNILDLQLSVVANNPLVAGDYIFGSALQHAGNFYSITNNVTLTFYQTPIQPQINSSITIQVIPEQASAEAIYVVRVPTQILNDKLSLNFGNFGVQLTSNTKISYFQPEVNATASSTDTTNWLDQQSYFSLLQQTYTNSLNFGLTQMSDLSQDIMINTNMIPKSVDGWTYVILSPITNPSSSSATDTLQMKILDTITTNTSTYDTLVNQLSISMNLNIQNPPSNIYQTQYSVIDNDILSSTKHTVTFKLDRQLFANQDGRQNVQLIIDPPTSSMASIKTVETCLYYQSISNLIECKLTQIGTQELSFKPTTTNLTFAPETPFILEFKNITNPENETFCTPKIATEKDYLASYFEVKIFIDKKLEYQSVFVGMLDDSVKPCVEFKTKKGDILHNLPAILNAGFETPFNISITQPTASLRVFLSTNDSDLVFSSSVIYFNAYDKMFINLKAIVSSNAVNKTVEVYLKREQTSAFNSFREPQSFIVRIIAGQKETVGIYEMQSSSVGYDIKIPIALSKPSVNNMTLLLTIDNSTILQPYLKFFTFSTLEVPIPALSSTSFFTVKYNGTKIPPTFSISMRLLSQNNPTHILLKDVIYLYFSIDPKYQTLPPIMKMDLLWLYKTNNDLQSKTIFYCCAANETTTLANNTMMLPVIIETKILVVTATKTDIQISTRSEATLFYQLREKGKHFELENITSKGLRTHNLSQSVQTIRNSTKIVNANQVLNFTNLQHETEYFLYISAFDAFGDSEKVTILMVKTSALSKAIKFNLNCYQIETDEVKIVRALADILKIDMRRIRVVSSEQNLAKTFSVSEQNKPIYAHEIVISPSLTDDSMSPEDLFKTKLVTNTQNQGFLKEKIPSWTGNFDPISQFQEKKSYYEISRVQPTFKEAPTALKISYYNASISVQLWAKARISAVILVQERVTPDNGIDFVNKKPKGKKVSALNATEKELSPNSKQIIKGLNQFNQKLAPKYTFSGMSNEQGEGVVFFKGLKPGSYCKVYITAQNPEDYEPTTAIADTEVYMIDFNLMWNPNLKGNDHLALNELKKKNQKMYNVIKEFYQNQDNANKKSTQKTTLKKAV